MKILYYVVWITALPTYCFGMERDQMSESTPKKMKTSPERETSTALATEAVSVTSAISNDASLVVNRLLTFNPEQIQAALTAMRRQDSGRERIQALVLAALIRRLDETNDRAALQRACLLLEQQSAQANPKSEAEKLKILAGQIAEQKELLDADLEKYIYQRNKQ